MSANDKQVDGGHYQAKIQHWDFAYANDLNIFEVYITKYVSRCRKKHPNPLIDLYKARHTLDKYIEIIEEDEGLLVELQEKEMIESRRRTGA